MGTDNTVDLFGNPAPSNGSTAKSYTESNDMEIVQHVIATAMVEGGGYAIVGLKPTVYHRCGGDQVEPVPSYEQAMVCQLLDRKVLSAGAPHTYSHGERSVSGRSVLVPKSTQVLARRWRSLTPLAAPRSARQTGHIRDAVSGRPARSTSARSSSARSTDNRRKRS